MKVDEILSRPITAAATSTPLLVLQVLQQGSMGKPPPPGDSQWGTHSGLVKGGIPGDICGAYLLCEHKSQTLSPALSFVLLLQ